MRAISGSILVLAGVVALGFDGLIAAHNGQERHFLGIGGIVIGLVGALQLGTDLASATRSKGTGAGPSAEPGAAPDRGGI